MRMRHESYWRIVALISLLVIEVWVFSGSFGKYFNLDSAFYVVYSPRTWPQVLRTFTEPDPGKQFRPLTLGFMALFVPSFGLDARPYHWIPLVFHALNTVLFFSLARRLLNGSLAALAAATFWGVHSVAGWVTYDTTCVSDFMLAFLLLASLIMAVDGSLRHSGIRISGSILLYVLALLTKEAALTAPLALMLCLMLAHIRFGESGTPIRGAFRKALPLTGTFLGIALAYAGLLLHWFRAGLLYTQGSGTPYNINPWANLLAKAKYLYWALNLPDALVIRNAARTRVLIFCLMGFLFACLFAEILKRKGRLDAAGWAGLVWLVGMNAPALMLSDRLAKWYLYVPLFGLSMTVGTLLQSASNRFRGFKAQVAVPAALAICLLPTLYSSVAQTRSYLASSDASYASEVLDSFAKDLQGIVPAHSAHTTMLLLPTFEPDLGRILSSPPADTGKLIEMQHPGLKVKMLFAHKGERLSAELRRNPDTRVLQILDGRLYDVTRFYRGGRMTAFVLPTFERAAPPLLKKEPIGGTRLFQSHMELLFGDEGACLPEGYASREDLWILQYVQGNFCDVTDYYKGRRLNRALHLIRDIQSVQATVNRSEFYPSYDRFATPTGAPVFFPTPQKEILTVIGGSTAVIPAVEIPTDARLRFDISWMFDLGDGGWAELLLRTQGRETVVYRKYVNPNPKGKGLNWTAVEVDLAGFAGLRAEVVLRCYNDRGKNTIADWLNWRDIAIEENPAQTVRALPPR